MTVIKSASGKKAVNIHKSNDGFICMFVQIDHANQREQVLESKRFKSIKSCEKYADMVL